jgi:hypothetical protein
MSSRFRRKSTILSGFLLQPILVKAVDHFFGDTSCVTSALILPIYLSILSMKDRLCRSADNHSLRH